MPRVVSRTSRARDRLEQLKLLAVQEKPLQKKVAKIISKQGKTLAAYYNQHGHVDVHVLNKHKADFNATLVVSFTRVIAAFSARIKRLVKKDSTFDITMRQWLLHRAMDTIANIDSTTVGIVQTVIANGADNGRTLDQITQDIVDATSSDLAMPRAGVIARTELHTAAQEGSLQAAKSTGIQGLTKTWTASLDNRTREDHSDADGQTVGIDESFSVGGEDLDRPGDGSAEESVNCRCVLTFDTSDDEDDSGDDEGEGGDSEGDDSDT